MTGWAIEELSVWVERPGWCGYVTKDWWEAERLNELYTIALYELLATT